MKLRSSLVLGGFVGLVVAVAAIGGWLTSLGQPEWYESLSKPSWTPPSWLFGPAWTVLYLLMAVAAWLVWRRAGFDGATAALTVFFIQLGLNLAWSGIFFALRSPGWALVEILILWVAIVVTIILFFRHSTLAGWLLVPYLLWVSFATALNAAIVRLN